MYSSYNKFLNELKQLRGMWYNHINKYLLKEGFVNNLIYPQVFIKKLETRYTIIIECVNDLNLVETLEKFTKTITYLRKEFEMKDLKKTIFFSQLSNQEFSK